MMMRTMMMTTMMMTKSYLAAGNCAISRVRGSPDLPLLLVLPASKMMTSATAAEPCK